MANHLASCCVMCCGCMRFLRKDGTLQKFTGGIVELPNGSKYQESGTADEDRDVFYGSREDCDALAIKHGWTVSAGDHRCPNCSQRIVVSVQRGAYVPMNAIRKEHAEVNRG